MRMRRRPELLLVTLVLVAVAAIVVVVLRGSGGKAHSAPAFTWRGIVGDVRPPVALGERMVVVLRAPSLAQRLAKAGSATRAQERRWTSQVYAGQQHVLTMLSAHGLGVH